MDQRTGPPAATARQLRADRILDVAGELLLRWGYNRVTIDDVAARADVGKGTIYLHYKTREALFLAVLAREYAAAIDELVASLGQEPTAALLHRVMRTFFLAIMRRPLARALFVTDLEVLGKLVRGTDAALEARLNQALVDYVRLLRRHGLLRADLGLDELAYALSAVVSGFFLTDALDGDPFQLELERKAELLETTVQRAFAIADDPPAEALRAAQLGVVELWTEIADLVRVYIRGAGEP